MDGKWMVAMDGKWMVAMDGKWMVAIVFRDHNLNWWEIEPWSDISLIHDPTHTKQKAHIAKTRSLVTVNLSSKSKMSQAFLIAWEIPQKLIGILTFLKQCMTLAPSDSSPTNHHPQRFSKLRTEDHIVVGLAGLAHRMILLWQKLSTLKLVFSCFVEQQWRQKNGCRCLLKDTAPLNGNVDKYKSSQPLEREIIYDITNYMIRHARWTIFLVRKHCKLLP